MKRKDLFRRIIIILFILAFFLTVYLLIGRPMLKFVGDTDKLKTYIESKGIRGIMIFCCLVAVQTASSCIPGTPFYMGAGYALGGLKGAILCDAGATLGNTFAFLMGRKFGRKLLENLFSEKQIQSVDQYVKKGNPRLIHVMFMLLPLPKDIYSWFGYYSEENVLTWIIITFVMRFPNIFLYSLGGNKIQQQQYGVLIIGTAAAVLFYVVIFFRMKKLRDRKDINDNK
ncbi:TVP38/TMEM64 family protein [Butyrivibrio sp. JL13D10]|uniref:TVP38/TMEM64 family protein n=1 Tax=Butyrivibrio sp. JL13D10 TaxID=3236815 RepID=UPI0038B5755E